MVIQYFHPFLSAISVLNRVLKINFYIKDTVETRIVRCSSYNAGREFVIDVQPSLRSERLMGTERHLSMDGLERSSGYSTVPIT